MSRIYNVKQKLPESQNTELSAYHPLVRQLLYNRGLADKSEAQTFLSPNFKNHLHDPFLLPDMGVAVDRILHAIDNGEKTAIWSDYDADGIPGGALLHDFFKLIGYKNFINYIPDRHTEGYGLNIEGMERLNDGKINLIITIDCGIRDVKEVARAKELGMDAIITDHHEPGEELPSALAIVNPKLKNSKYPEQILCGSGVVWKLIEAVLQKRRALLQEGQEKWLLDLAGIATLSDMVPLTGENRALAHFGLAVLRKTRRPGLRKLYSMLKINPAHLTEDDIGFLITPRINAASRMGRPKDAFDLLTAETEGEAEAIAKHLDSINKERKVVVAGIVKEANRHIKARIESHGEKPVIVLGNPSWRPALLGLAANSIAEEYNRPVFLWGRGMDDSEVNNIASLKGSCRSDGSTDLVALMERAKSAFSEFGGHKFSGGFSVDFEKIDQLENALVDACTHIVNDNSETLCDAEINLNDVNEKTAKEINSLAPFGMGNEKPVFILRNVIPMKIDRFGKGKEHMSVQLQSGSAKAKAIGFFIPPDKFGTALQEGLATNLVATIELSYFNSYRPETRLRIVDFF
jgi:single-stranded-DNA-specific exonuclease